MLKLRLSLLLVVLAGESRVVQERFSPDWSVADLLPASSPFDCLTDAAGLSPHVFAPSESPCEGAVTVSGLVATCCPVSPSTSLVLTLYQVQSRECGQEVLYRAGQGAWQGAWQTSVVQHNRTHGHFSLQLYPALLSQPAYCLLLDIGNTYSHTPPKRAK